MWLVSMDLVLFAFAEVFVPILDGVDRDFLFGLLVLPPPTQTAAHGPTKGQPTASASNLAERTDKKRSDGQDDIVGGLTDSDQQYPSVALSLMEGRFGQ